MTPALLAFGFIASIVFGFAVTYVAHVATAMAASV